MTESPKDNIHKKASRVLADKISQVISNEYISQHIIAKLISNLIENQMNQFFEEHENLMAETIFNSFKNELIGWHPDKNKLISFNTETPDYEHARHGKLSTFARELREKIVLIRKD